MLDKFAKVGIDLDTLGAQFLKEGTGSFIKSWNDLVECIASKSEAFNAA